MNRSCGYSRGLHSVSNEFISAPYWPALKLLCLENMPIPKIALYFAVHALLTSQLSHSETIASPATENEVASWPSEPNISIHQESNRRVIISGSCEDVLNAAKLFSTAANRPFPQIRHKDAKCSVNIANLLPDFYPALESKTLLGESLHSANCWGYALAAAGVLPIPQQIFSYELRTLLESPLCHQVKEPRSGDLGLIRLRDPRQDNHDVHGFIYISPTLRHSKVNAGPGAPVKFEVGTKYGSGNEAIGDYNYDVTEHFIEYWRCSSLKSWGHEHPQEPEADAIKRLINARHELMRLTNEASARQYPTHPLNELDRALAKLPKDGVLSRLIRKQTALLKKIIHEIGIGLPTYCSGPECPSSCRSQPNTRELICPRLNKR
jgi:hypothetical protein